MSIKQKEELAKLMRHSAETAERIYNKLDVECGNIEPLPIIQATLLVEVDKPIEKKKYFDLKGYLKNIGRNIKMS